MRLSSPDHSPLIARTRVLAINSSLLMCVYTTFCDRKGYSLGPSPFLLLCGGGEERVYGMGSTAGGALAGMLARA